MQRTRLSFDFGGKYPDVWRDHMEVRIINFNVKHKLKFCSSILYFMFCICEAWLGLAWLGEMTGVAILVGDDYWVMIVSVPRQASMWGFLPQIMVTHGNTGNTGQIIVNFYYIYNLSLSRPADQTRRNGVWTIKQTKSSPRQTIIRATAPLITTGQ